MRAEDCPDLLLDLDDATAQQVFDAFDRLHLDGLPGAFDLGREEVEALYAAGHQLLGKGDLKRAREAFNFLVICESQDARFWTALAVVLHKQKDWPAAIDAYSMAALLDATNVRLYFHAAECLMQSRDWPRAQQSLEAFFRVSDNVYGKDQSKIRQFIDKAEAWQRIIDAKVSAQARPHDRT
ncbi:MAG: hypothetical protein OXI88_02645 [Gammaproteobacteria bacterium]|nr:hypothetical protein [Gammaproteobacteria bacterium]MDE0282991.1 hypothetical protein [Gammaproteobacteria bacterium]MDE0510670.1 hypothetical protein [Gammaproteobacteria bacterium]